MKRSGGMERRSDSEQPVHSWKWSQITARPLVGRFRSRGHLAASSKGSPIMAVTVTQVLRKSRRETPHTVPSSFIVPPGIDWD